MKLMQPAPNARLQYDFSVYDNHGRLAALVEVKRRFGTDSSWARAWHASIVERTGGPIDASIVLFTGDRIYVWRPGSNGGAAPDWVFEARRWLAPYVDQLRIPIGEVTPYVFEEVVGMWLRDAVLGKLPDGTEVEAEALLDAFRGGEVVQQAAA